MIPANLNEKKLMQVALQEAEKALLLGEIPIGAVILDENGEVIARAHNEQLGKKSTIAHAELLAITDAIQARSDKFLAGCTLAVTLEPCIMCAGAIAHARLKKVLIGAWDEKTGACGSVYDVLRDKNLPHPAIEVVGGVLESEAGQILRDFFAAKRS